MRDRFTALHNPKAEIVLFLEFIPQTIAAWIKNQYVLGVENFKRALIFTEKNLNLTIAFMKDHGLIHFDTQQTLFQTAKMTSLGEMAGGIAHEINTPLAIILSATHQIETYLGVAPPNIEKSLYKLQKN